MKITHTKNDIGIIEDVFPSFLCPQLVEKIDDLQKNKALLNRKQTENAPKSFKDDFSLCIHTRDLDIKLGSFVDENNNKVRFSSFIPLLHEALGLYSDEAVYEDIKNLELWLPVFKIQKTIPGGGYHLWHHESGQASHGSRYIVFILYLNSLDPENAGETEFIRQELKVTPKENTIVFWPATYTHPHRGNPVYGDKEKYVLTGWLFI